MLDDLPGILSWNQLGAGPFALRAEFLQRLEDGYERWLSGASVSGGESLRAALSLLPNPERRRLLRSPWLSDGLLRLKDPLLDESLAVKVLSAALAQEGSPRTVEAIAVDHAGVLPLPEVAGPSDERVTDSECTAACRKIDQALSILRELTPDTHRLIREFVEVFVIRAVPGSGSVGSTSFYRLIGALVLRNAHLEKVAVESVMDVIVHETIHIVLSAFERLRGRFVRKWEGIQMPSPWTGVRLDLPVYVHAFCVWYGLYHLWSLAGRTHVPGLSRARAEELRQRAARGFRSRPITSGLRPYLGKVRTDMVPVLETMEERMLAAS